MKFRHFAILTAIAVSFAFLLSNCASPRLKAADAEMTAIFNHFEAVGIGAAVVKDGKIIYDRSFGLKDIETRTPLSGTDLFRIASISKSFVAVGLMQLVDEGKLSLEDDISKLVGFEVRNPYYPEEIITLRMILSHVSSLTDNAGYFSLDPINPEITRERAGSFNDCRPGTRYEYCNLGFNIAGTILERVSGQRFDRYIKEHIFDRLGIYGGHNVNELDESRFVSLYRQDDSLHRYVRSEDAYSNPVDRLVRYKMGYSAPIFSPAGGVKISPADLARYMTMHMNLGTYQGERILSQKNAALMQSDSLALMSFDWIPGKTLIGHTGDAYGLYSVMVFSPEEKWGIVAMTNGIKDSGAHEDFLRQSVTRLYETLIK